MKSFTWLATPLLLTLCWPVWAVEPPASTGIVSANECINIQRSNNSIVPTKVTNTCDQPVAFSDWFCGTEADPCTSRQDNRWSEETDPKDKRGGIYLLCPRGEQEWQANGYDCLPTLLVWRSGIYAYGACYLSEPRIEHWTNNIDSTREPYDRYIGDTYAWHDACERWLTKRTRDVAKSNESPVKEDAYFDLSPPTLYQM